MADKRYFIVVHEEHCEDSQEATLEQAIQLAEDCATDGETYFVAEVHCEVGPTESPVVVKKLE